MCCFWSLEYILAQIASHPGLWCFLPLPTNHSTAAHSWHAAPPSLFGILAKIYLAVYALLQSKGSRRAETIHQFPRLFSSAIATIVSFIMAAVLGKAAWFCSQFSGLSTGSLNISAIFCAPGGKHASVRQLRKLSDLEKGKQNCSNKWSFCGICLPGTPWELGCMGQARAIHQSKRYSAHKSKTHKFVMTNMILC